jgi:Na+/melibiose symporter-like transporter
MAGLIPHLIAGCALYFIGRYYFKTYFEADNKTKKQLLLAIVCIAFSLAPDIFLGTYYTTHILSFDTLMPYQIFAHYVLIPIAIALLALLIFRLDTKRKPIWIMGIAALALHFIMDLFLEEAGLFI